MTTSEYGGELAGDPTGGAIVAVGEAIRELGEAGRMVAEEVKHDRQQRRRTDRVVMLLLVLLVLAVGAAGAFGYQSYKLNNFIADCTTPGGKCYEASKAQNAANRSALTRANLFIVACTRTGARTDDELRTCIEKKLTAAGIDISLITPNQPPAVEPTMVPSGPPADATIEPPSSDQPDESSPAQSPVDQAPADDPPPVDNDTGGETP